MSPIAANEFSRIALLATLPGDRLGDLASRMKRENVQPGKTVVRRASRGKRFYVVLEGMLEVTQGGLGEQRTMLKPGDEFGEVALAMDIPRTASVRAVMPATVASCDKATFDEFVRPLFAEDEPERAS